MKKNLLFILSISFCFIFILSFSANACHFEDLELTADCEGYSITGEVWANWSYHSGAIVSYNLSLTGVDEYIPVSGQIEIIADSEGDSGIPFEITGEWGEIPCGDIVIEGTVEWLKINNPSYVEDNETFDPIYLDCPCDEEWCPRTPGYWKTHPEAWPVDELSIGSDDYTKEQLLVMLWQPVKGNMDTILIKHLIAAKLNVLSGSDADSIEQTINDADDYLATGSYDKDSAEELKDILDEFNNSGDCD